MAARTPAHSATPLKTISAARATAIAIRLAIELHMAFPLPRVVAV
jgi:hypothetical protein